MLGTSHLSLQMVWAERGPLFGSGSGGNPPPIRAPTCQPRADLGNGPCRGEVSGLPGWLFPCTPSCRHLIPWNRPCFLEAWVIKGAGPPAGVWAAGPVTSGLRSGLRVGGWGGGSRWVAATCCRAPGHTEGRLPGGDPTAPGRGVAGAGRGGRAAVAGPGAQAHQGSRGAGEVGRGGGTRACQVG